jgi:hypothetical protein
LSFFASGHAWGDPDCGIKLQSLFQLPTKDLVYWQTHSPHSRRLLEEFETLSTWLSEAPTFGLEWLAVTNALAPPLLHPQNLKNLSRSSEIQDLEVLLTTEIKDFQKPIQGLFFAFQWSTGTHRELMKRLMQSPFRVVLLAKVLSALKIETPLKSGEIADEMSVQDFFILSRRLEHWLNRGTSLKLVLASSSILREAYTTVWVSRQLPALWGPDRTQTILESLHGIEVTPSTRWRIRATRVESVDYSEFERWRSPILEWFADNVNYIFTNGKLPANFQSAPPIWREHFLRFMRQLESTYPKVSTPPLVDSYIQLAQAIIKMSTTMQDESGHRHLKPLLANAFRAGRLRGAAGGLIAGAALSLVSGIKVAHGPEIASAIMSELRNLASAVLKGHFPVPPVFNAQQALEATDAHVENETAPTVTMELEQPEIQAEVTGSSLPVYDDIDATADDLSIFIRNNSINDLKPNTPYKVIFRRYDGRHRDTPQLVIFTARAIEEMKDCVRFHVDPIRWILAIRLGVAATVRQGGINWLFEVTPEFQPEAS